MFAHLVPLIEIKPVFEAAAQKYGDTLELNQDLMDTLSKSRGSKLKQRKVREGQGG